MVSKAKKCLCIVRRVAETLVRMNQPYYSKTLLKLLPREFLDTAINEANRKGIVLRVNSIRLKIEDELADFLGLGFGWKNKPGKKEKLTKAISSPQNALPEALEDKKREIKFLFNLATAINHL